MASITLFHFLIILTSVALLHTPTSVVHARKMPMKLENDGGSGQSECWTALAEVRSCSNEIMGFFLSGRADIDRPCCLAAAAIARRCWPALVASLGYSPEELSFLQSYCDRTTAASPSPSPSPLYELP